MRLKVVVTAYNVREWIERCLVSIASQTDTEYDICVVDDGSPIESGQAKFVEEFCSERGWDYVLNQSRIGAPLPNQITAIERLGGEKEDVIVVIDGDDWLPHSGVFTHLRNVYSDPNVWVAYGTQRNEPPSETTDSARPHPPAAWEHRRSVRGWTWENGIHFNHIRTFRHGLFERMDPAQWRWPDGNWFLANSDTMLFIPALEMAGYEHTKYMPEINYVYTPDHSQSEWKTRTRDCNPQFLMKYTHYSRIDAL